jgi:hypothetical protein
VNAALGYLRELRQATVDGWNRFWFTPADAATLGLIRLLAGAMLLYTHLVWTVDLEGFFGTYARLPADFAHQAHESAFAWSYLYWISSPASLWSVHVAALVVLAMLMAGLFTRVTSILAFLITISYIHRAPFALFGLDNINAMLAMYLMIGPSGAAYSLDRLLGIGTGSGDRGTRSKDAPLPASRSSIPTYTSANLAIRLIQVHMCIIYLFAGFGKLQGETWWNGMAMWGAFANYEYQTLDMTWLAAHPLVINFLTHLTIAWECSYIVLIWPRLTRPLMLALAVPLHLGIAVCMGMITFGLVMLIANLAFVSPALIRSVVATFVPNSRGSAGTS